MIADEQEETPGESSSQTTYLIQLQVEHLESQLSRVNQSEIALRRENSTLLGVNKKLQIEVEAHRRRQANQSSLINKLRNKMRDDISILELEKAEMGKLKGALEEERGDARPVSDGAVVRVAPRPDGLTIKKKAIKSTEGAENTLAAQRREAKRNELGVGVPLRPTKENGNSSTWLDTSSSKLDTPSSLAQFRRTLSRPDQLKGITPPGRSALSKPKRKKARKSDGISRSPFLKPVRRSVPQRGLLTF